MACTLQLCYKLITSQASLHTTLYAGCYEDKDVNHYKNDEKMRQNDAGDEMLQNDVGDEMLQNDVGDEMRQKDVGDEMRQNDVGDEMRQNDVGDEMLSDWHHHHLSPLITCLVSS